MGKAKRGFVLGDQQEMVIMFQDVIMGFTD